MTNVVTAIWLILWISEQAFSERVLVEKRRSVLPGDQREKFSTSGLNDLVVEFSACQRNRPYILLYLCPMSNRRLMVTLGRESTALWNCESDDSDNCKQIAEHLAVQIECNSYSPVWISWRISGKIQFGAGTEVGRKLYFDAVVDDANCSGITEWVWGTEIGEDTVQMALHRSQGENRCYLTRPERVERVACGDVYTDEAWCLSCGCCYDRLSTDQLPCFYPQADDNERRRNCERTFEEVLGAVEFRSMQNPDSKSDDEQTSFLILLKQTIQTINVGLNFGDGTPPLNGVELDRSTLIPGCSSGCKYVDWLRAVVEHFYADAGDFEAVLTVTDSNRGAVPFVLRKTVVKVSQRLETVSLMSTVGETDETTFQLPGFNPVLQKEFRCDRFETRILYDEDSDSDNRPTTAESWKKKEAFEGSDDSLEFKELDETLAFDGSNGSIGFEGNNGSKGFEGNNGSTAFEGNNRSIAFQGNNVSIKFEGQNEPNAVKEMNGSLTFEGRSDSLPSDKWNGSLTFESARSITFMSVIESDCFPSVPRYIISWSLRRLASNGNHHHDDDDDDVSQRLVSSSTRFNIPSRSLSRGTYEVHLEVRMFDAFRTPINISNSIASFNVVPSKEDGFIKYHFLNGTVKLTNDLSGPGLSYQWLCTTRQLVDVSEVETHIDDDHPFGNCMTDGASAKTLIASSRNQLFPASFLHFSSLPASFYFHSIIRSSRTEASSILSTTVTIVELLPSSPPIVYIRCITGCSRPHSKSNPIWLEGGCVDCGGNAELLSYDWTFDYAQKSNAHLRSFNWAEDSATGNDRSYVVVYPDKFMKSVAQDEFSFTLTVTQADMTSSDASFHYGKENPEYDVHRDLSHSYLKTGTNASSYTHLSSNVLLVTTATLLCFSCQPEQPLFDMFFTL